MNNKPKAPKTPKPDTQARSLCAAKLTPAHLEGLQDAYDRALDDWQTYKDGPYGPTDFGGEQEWTEHVKSTNAGLKKASAALNILRRAMQKG